MFFWVQPPPSTQMVINFAWELFRKWSNSASKLPIWYIKGHICKILPTIFFKIRLPIKSLVQTPTCSHYIEAWWRHKCKLKVWPTCPSGSWLLNTSFNSSIFSASNSSPLISRDTSIQFNCFFVMLLFILIYLTRSFSFSRFLIWLFLAKNLDSFTFEKTFKRLRPSNLAMNVSNLTPKKLYRQKN